MDYKEKYEMALEGIQEILGSGADSIKMSRLQLRLQGIFPELKESEDERIRKELLKSFKYQQRELRPDKEWLNGIKLSEVVDWLEKQGEQKSVSGNDRETEINLVKILKHYPRETELYSPLYGKLWLAEVNEEHEIITCYKHPLDEGCTRAILEQEDTISFYSNGTTGLPDFNVSEDCMLFLYDIEKQGEQKPAEWGEEDEEYLQNIVEWIGCRINYEDCGDMTYKEHEEFYLKRINWLNSLKERIKEK